MSQNRAALQANGSGLLAALIFVAGDLFKRRPRIFDVVLAKHVDANEKPHETGIRRSVASHW